MIDCILPAIKEHMEPSEFSDIQDNDHEEHFKDSLIKVFADIGLYGITLGKTQGGLGLNYIAYIQILELLASFDASYALLVAATNTLLIEPLDSLSQNKELMNLILHGEVYGTGAVVFDNTAYIIDPNSFHKKYISIYSNDSVSRTCSR